MGDFGIKTSEKGGKICNSMFFCTFAENFGALISSSILGIEPHLRQRSMRDIRAQGLEVLVERWYLYATLPTVSTEEIMCASKVEKKNTDLCGFKNKYYLCNQLRYAQSEK